jgi:ATP-dependent DNA helicase RecQ
MPPTTARRSLQPLQEVIARHWGYNDFRPLQEDAMRAVLEGRDSLVVLPTGGGKSLCYQAPAVLQGGTTVVVSPLIALMKDQVDSLRSNGVPAVQLDSSLSGSSRAAHEASLRRGEVRLLFVSPERLVQTDLYRLLQEIGVRTFAVDEAHCISHWGHDFRPEFRQLAHLREVFPEASVHAYTATATEQVRRDICAQLGMRDPVVLVGHFDRGNLTYRVLPRHEPLRQTLEVINRHPGEGGIIYCLTKREVDELAANLRRHKVEALPYHAGMTTEDRAATQEAFLQERCDVVVATVAFGMGIDRSNVRFVLHTGMPKSLEHYQQETGRAGRDGLNGECVLLYSGGDVARLRSMLEKSARESEADASYLATALKHLDDMDRYCRGAVCRHRALVAYFGQTLDKPTCGACDLCLGDTEEVPEATLVARKLLSCVARVKESFGIGHVIAVLRGEDTEAVRRRGHEKLTTYGLLPDAGKADLRDWIYQLIGQGMLLQVGDEYPLLKLNEASWEVMRGQREVRLVRLKRRSKGEGPEKSQAEEISWDGVDRDLFEVLRGLRRDLATEKQVPPYVVFSDATLRELARVRPTTLERMRQLYGIGDAKLRDYGPRFLELLTSHCAAHGLSTDVRSAAPAPAPAAPKPVGARLAGRLEEAYAAFRNQASVAEVANRLNLSVSTVTGYLEQFIREVRPASIKPWVADDLYLRIVTAGRQVGTERLKPAYLLLGETVPYDAIRLVFAHLKGVESSTHLEGSAETP